MMNVLESIFNTAVLEVFGLTLMHSLWQGAVVALVLAFLLFILRKSSSKLRYYVASGSLAAFFTATVVTFLFLFLAKQTEQGVSMAEEYAFAYIFLGEEEALTNVARSTSVWGVVGEMSLYFQSHAPLIMAAWMMGVLVLTLRLAGGYTLAQRMKTYKTTEVEPYWISKLEKLIDRVGVRASVKMMESGIAKVPMVIGHLKPVILIPTGMLTGLTPHQVEAILAHELAHIKRNDYLVNLVQSFIEIVMFYHPATWWISACIREERENACDDIAIEICGDSITFARALTSLEQRTLGAPQLAMAFYGKKGSLINRVRRLIGKPNPQGNLPEGIVLLSLLFLTFFSFAFQAEDPIVFDGGKDPEAAVVAAQKAEFEYLLAQHSYSKQDSTKDKSKDKGKKDKKKDKNKKKSKTKIDHKKGSVVITGDEEDFPFIFDIDEIGLDQSFPLIINADSFAIKEVPFIMPVEPKVFSPKFDSDIFVYPDDLGVIQFPKAPKGTIFRVDDKMIFSYDNVWDDIDPIIIENKIKFPKKPTAVTITSDPSIWAFAALDSPTVELDSVKMEEYRKAQEARRKAYEKMRMQLDSQRVAVEKARKEYLEKYQEEMEKYRENLEKQREELRVARRKEMEYLREASRKRAEEMRVRSEEMRVKVEKARKEQEEFWMNIREELVEDGLLDDKDGALKMSLSDEEMKVNGKKVSDDLHKKYKKMFGDKFSGGNFQWKTNKHRVEIDLND